MPLVRAGAASIHDPKQWRAEDRVACGENAWAVLSGTVNTVGEGSENEADAAFPVAEAFVRAGVPPSLDEMLECFLAMDRAVAAWAAQSEHGLDDLWGAGLAAVLLVVDGDVARIAHVGTVRAYQLHARGGTEPLVAEALTHDHSLAELARRRSDLAAVSAGDIPGPVILSSLGHGDVARVDLSRIRVVGVTRLVLASRGAHRGLETPLAYLREVRSPWKPPSASAPRPAHAPWPPESDRVTHRRSWWTSTASRPPDRIADSAQRMESIAVSTTSSALRATRTS